MLVTWTVLLDMLSLPVTLTTFSAYFFALRVWSSMCPMGRPFGPWPLTSA